MIPDRRSKLADYISSAIRFATTETGLQWPSGTILVAASYSELAELDTIIGIKIFAMDLPSSYDFFVAFPSEEVNSYKLQKEFLNYIEMYSEDNFK